MHRPRVDNVPSHQRDVAWCICSHLGAMHTSYCSQCWHHLGTASAHTAWIIQHQLIAKCHQIEVNIGTFATVSARQAAPSEVFNISMQQNNVCWLDACLTTRAYMILIVIILWQSFYRRLKLPNSELLPNSDQFSMIIDIFAHPRCLNNSSELLPN